MITARGEGTGSEPLPMMIETRLGNVECAVLGSGPGILLLHGAMGGYDPLWMPTLTCNGGRCADYFTFVADPCYFGRIRFDGRWPGTGCCRSAWPDGLAEHAGGLEGRPVPESVDHGRQGDRLVRVANGRGAAGQFSPATVPACR